MVKRSLRDLYFSWLYSLVKPQKSKLSSYQKLSRILNERKFKWSVHNDDNRYEDGINLRDVFISEKDLDENHLEVKYMLKGDCTVLEVLVSLAQRMNDIMYDLEDTDNKTSRWFFEMINNLGLTRYTDHSAKYETFEIKEENAIHDILDRFIDRTYDYNGKGGLFPLKNKPPKHMAKVELWYQLMLYLDENYR